jgi:ribosomal protein S8
MFDGKKEIMSPNPFYHPVYFDSCAFDGGDESERQASIEARELFEENGGNINIVHSVMKEIEYPNTPQWVKDIANNSIFTIEVQLTSQEDAELKVVETIIVGNGNLEKRKSDCRHIFEAQKYGRYFVTTDNGILKHGNAIKKKFSTLSIVKPSEFLEIVKQNIN